jgi:ribosomal protein S18
MKNFTDLDALELDNPGAVDLYSRQDTVYDERTGKLLRREVTTPDEEKVAVENDKRLKEYAADHFINTDVADAVDFGDQEQPAVIPPHMLNYTLPHRKSVAFPEPTLESRIENTSPDKHRFDKQVCVCRRVAVLFCVMWCGEEVNHCLFNVV